MITHISREDVFNGQRIELAQQASERALSPALSCPAHGTAGVCCVDF